MNKQIILQFYPEWGWRLPLTLPDGMELGSAEAEELYADAIASLSDDEILNMAKEALRGGYHYDEIEVEE